MTTVKPGASVLNTLRSRLEMVFGGKVMAKTTEELFHLVKKLDKTKVVCETESRGFATPEELPPPRSSSTPPRGSSRCGMPGPC